MKQQDKVYLGSQSAISNKIILNFGKIAASANAITVTIPSAYSNAKYSICHTFIDATTVNSFGPKEIAVLSKTATTFKVQKDYTDRGSSNWIAIGY